MKKCAVCDHPHREKIEQALFKVAPEGSSVTTEAIADEFEVSVDDLRRHMMFHTPMGEEGADSIVRRSKIREMELLGVAAREYLGTLTQVGSRIRGYATEDDTAAFEKKISKPTVDLYLGCGDNLQKTVRALADVDNLLNGPKDDGLQGLAALANAIHKSRQMASENDGD